jgi:alpha-beta hydrolase superfamily lysophospholipase
MARKTTTKTRFWSRHRHFKHFLIGLAVIILLIAAWTLIAEDRTSRQQSKLQPFYSTADLPLKGTPGQVVKQEPLGVAVDGGQGIRVLYRTQRADGSYTFSSGMVFIPNNSNAGTPRPVVAWAHGTLGLGDSCAPSRTPDPVGNIAWVSTMLKKGWVVTATDYAGFGTAGTQGYLVGGDEAHDVLNSVRAARNITRTQAGSSFAIWGHSQGGNSALFSAQEAATYAPELRLIGTVASAPAAELVPLLNEQYGTAADWIIGPLIATSWPAANKNLRISDVLTADGRNNYQKIANHCIARATIAGLIRDAFGQKFFTTNPIDVPAWRTMAQQQSAPLPAPDQPLLVVESKTDKVVLPNTTALYIQTTCKVDNNLSTLWLNKASHQKIPDISADNVIDWIAGRFADQPNSSSCNQPLPFKPATVPAAKN